MDKKECYYDETKNYLFVKTEDNGKKLSDYIFIHEDNDTGKGFLAHFKSYKDDTPLEIFTLNRISVIDIEQKYDGISHTSFTDEMSWKRIRINAILPTNWEMLFDEIMNKI